MHGIVLFCIITGVVMGILTYINNKKVVRKQNSNYYEELKFWNFWDFDNNRNKKG